MAAALAACVFFTYGQALPEEAAAFVYDSKGKRDPFVPLLERTARDYVGLEDIERPEQLILEGILWDKAGGSIAVLNGTVVREGDKVNAVELLEIRRNEVLLSIGSKKHKITLEETVKGGGDEF